MKCLGFLTKKLPVDDSLAFKNFSGTFGCNIPKKIADAKKDEVGHCPHDGKGDSLPKLFLRFPRREGLLMLFVHE